MSFRLLNVDVELTGLELNKLRRPCVYGWRRDGEWLYIGFSTRGIHRAMDSYHTAFGTYEVLESDSIYFWSPDNMGVERLKLLEEVLIKELKPKFNDKNWKRKNRKVSVAKIEAERALFLVENE